MVDKIFMFWGLKPLKSCYTVWEHDPFILANLLVKLIFGTRALRTERRAPRVSF